MLRPCVQEFLFVLRRGHIRYIISERYNYMRRDPEINLYGDKPMARSSRVKNSLQSLCNRTGLGQLQLQVFGRQINLWQRGNYQAWLLASAGAVDMNRLDGPELTRTVTDHQQVKAISLGTTGSVVNGVQLMTISHTVKPAAPRQIDLLGLHQQWTLGRGFTNAFYLHGHCLVEFPRPTRPDQAVYFDAPKDENRWESDQMKRCRNHVLFYCPKDNVACGLVLPPTTDPQKFQIGGAFSRNSIISKSLPLKSGT